jgi:hypothetical protein
MSLPICTLRLLLTSSSSVFPAPATCHMSLQSQQLGLPLDRCHRICLSTAAAADASTRRCRGRIHPPMPLHPPGLKESSFFVDGSGGCRAPPHSRLSLLYQFLSSPPAPPLFPTGAIFPSRPPAPPLLPIGVFCPSQPPAPPLLPTGAALSLARSPRWPMDPAPQSPSLARSPCRLGLMQRGIGAESPGDVEGVASSTIENVRRALCGGCAGEGAHGHAWQDRPPPAQLSHPHAPSSRCVRFGPPGVLRPLHPLLWLRACFGPRRVALNIFGSF